MPQPSVYNVVCNACEQVFQPSHRSALWWQAKQYTEKGHIDAMHISGEKCGCVKQISQPNAPYRVFGYDDTCRDYNIPFSTFTEAVKRFLEYTRDGDVVFIKGVSKNVEQQLQMM